MWDDELSVFTEEHTLHSYYFFTQIICYVELKTLSYLNLKDEQRTFYHRNNNKNEQMFPLRPYNTTNHSTRKMSKEMLSVSFFNLNVHHCNKIAQSKLTFKDQEKTRTTWISYWQVR